MLPIHFTVGCAPPRQTKINILIKACTEIPLAALFRIDKKKNRSNLIAHHLVMNKQPLVYPQNKAFPIKMGN